MSIINLIFGSFIKFVGGLRVALGLALFVGLTAALAAIFIFGWLADEMLEGDTMRFDEAVRLYVHSFSSPFLTEVMRILSFLGSTLFIVLLGLVSLAIFYYLQRRRAAMLFAITTVGGGLLLTTLKLFFRRLRPEPFFDTILPTSYSFPSGHSLGSFCFYMALAAIISSRVERMWLKILLWLAASMLVLFIGISRIYLGVHYPSDVVAGFIVGFIWVTTIAVSDKLLQFRKIKVQPVSLVSAQSNE